METLVGATRERDTGGAVASKRKLPGGRKGEIKLMNRWWMVIFRVQKSMFTHHSRTWRDYC